MYGTTAGSRAGLLAGLTVAVAIAAAIPIYTSASLQRGLVREWTESSTSRPPFAVMMSYWGTGAGPATGPGVPTPGETASEGSQSARPESPYERVHALLDGQVPAGIGIPYTTYARAGALGVKRFVPADPSRRPAQSPFADVWFISNLQDVAEIIDGRWPTPHSTTTLPISKSSSTKRPWNTWTSSSAPTTSTRPAPGRTKSR